VWKYIHATYGKQFRTNIDGVFHRMCLSSYETSQAEVLLTFIREVPGSNFRR
jgi:hypothetical protein